MSDQIYAVRTSEDFVTQSEATFDWLEVRVGLNAATVWLDGLQKLKASLATLPQRCAIASENVAYQKKYPGPPLRSSLYRHGRSTWRVLFTVHEASDDPAHVTLHQLRNSAQKPLTKWPSRE